MLNCQPLIVSPVTGRLPVVNVGPFHRDRHGHWCREKSFPEFYHEQHQNELKYPVIVQSSQPNDVKYPAIVQSNSAPAMQHPEKPSGVGGGKTVATSLDSSLQDQLVVGDMDLLRRSEDPGSKGEKVKPPTDHAIIPECLLPRRQATILSPRHKVIGPEAAIKALPKRGYAPTLFDREKTTVSESGSNKRHSLLTKAMSSEDFSQHQNIKLKGRHLHRPFKYGAAGRQSQASTFPRSLTFSMGGTFDAATFRSETGDTRRHWTQPKQRNNTPRYSSDRQPFLNLAERTALPLVALNHKDTDRRLSETAQAAERASVRATIEHDAGRATAVERCLMDDYATSYRLVKEQTAGCTTSSAPPLGKSAAIMGGTIGNHSNRGVYKLTSSYPTSGERRILVARQLNGRHTGGGRLIEAIGERDEREASGRWTGLEHFYLGFGE